MRTTNAIILAALFITPAHAQHNNVDQDRRIEQLELDRRRIDERCADLDARLRVGETYVRDMQAAQVRNRLTVEEQRMNLVLWLLAIPTTMGAATLFAISKTFLQSKRTYSQVNGRIEDFKALLKEQHDDVVREAVEAAAIRAKQDLERLVNDEKRAASDERRSRSDEERERKDNS